MDLIRDVLDKQVRDTQGRPLGKVDGLVIEVREPHRPRVIAIELGAVTLARRIGRRWERWATHLLAWWTGDRAPVHRIAWEKVLQVGIDVVVDVDAVRAPMLHGERWLRRRLRRLPGG